MFLAIDIGNTNVNLAIMDGMKVKKVFCAASALPPDRMKETISKQFVKLDKDCQFEHVIISSVAPQVLMSVAKGLSKVKAPKPIVVGRNVKVPLKNKYKDPKQVGQDRLVCAYGATYLYKAPVLVIDLGTAITFDVINEKEEYLGGIIVPGLRLSAESLTSKTALLPKTNIKGPTKLVGQSTQDSILSGLFNGYGAMIDGLIKRLLSEYDTKPKVIMTGGHTRLMQQFVSSKIHAVDEHLVFKGMALLLKEKII